MTKPEEEARAEIDRLLAAAGWSVQSVSAANLLAPRGVLEAKKKGIAARSCNVRGGAYGENSRK